MREIGSGTTHCPYDWLAVFDGRDEHAPLIGKFCGVGKFPYSIIGKYHSIEQKKFKNLSLSAIAKLNYLIRGLSGFN